jgi:hypothetical protein
MAVPRNPYGWAIPGTQAWKNAQLMNNSRNSFNNNPYLPWNRKKAAPQNPIYYIDPKTNKVVFNTPGKNRGALKLPTSSSSPAVPTPKLFSPNQKVNMDLLKKAGLLNSVYYQTYNKYKDPGFLHTMLDYANKGINVLADIAVWSKNSKSVAAGLGWHWGKDLYNNTRGVNYDKRENWWRENIRTQASKDLSDLRKRQSTWSATDREMAKYLSNILNDTSLSEMKEIKVDTGLSGFAKDATVTGLADILGPKFGKWAWKQTGNTMRYLGNSIAPNTFSKINSGIGSIIDATGGYVSKYTNQARKYIGGKISTQFGKFLNPAQAAILTRLPGAATNYAKNAFNKGVDKLVVKPYLYAEAGARGLTSGVRPTVTNLASKGSTYINSGKGLFEEKIAQPFTNKIVTPYVREPLKKYVSRPLIHYPRLAHEMNKAANLKPKTWTREWASNESLNLLDKSKGWYHKYVNSAPKAGSSNMVSAYLTMNYADLKGAMNLSPYRWIAPEINTRLYGNPNGNRYYNPNTGDRRHDYALTNRLINLIKTRPPRSNMGGGRQLRNAPLLSNRLSHSPYVMDITRYLRYNYPYSSYYPSYADPRIPYRR